MSRACSFGFGFAALGVWAAACAGAPPSAEAPPAPSASANALPAVTSEPAAPSSAAAAPASATPSVQAPPASTPALKPICLAKCDKLVPKCSTPQVETCRVNCSKYEPPPDGCVEQVQAALECARDASDLTCANVAPESCHRKFRAIAKCTAGEAAQGAEATPAGLPEGWERLSDVANGISAVLPKGSVGKAGPEGPVRSVTAPDGTLYTVSVLPLLKDKPSEKSFLHFLFKVMGRCSDKVKLDGFIEKAGQASMHYTAHCPDKTDWSGMLYSNSEHLVLLSAQAPLGKTGVTEPFFYQFEFGKH